MSGNLTRPHEVDVLAFGAHSDDVELGCGGLLIKLGRAGYRTGIVDLTRGELNSRATPEVIEREAEAAAKILGVSFRERLDLGDARLQDNFENRRLIAELIRRHRPKLVLAPYFGDRHPDHAVSGLLVRNAQLHCRLRRLEASYPPHAPKLLLFYFMHDYVPPTLVVDITDCFEEKMQAIRTYRSQFGRGLAVGASSGRDRDRDRDQDRDLMDPLGIGDYIFHIESRCRFYGSLINVRYGEAFLAPGPLGLADLGPLLGEPSGDT